MVLGEHKLEELDRKMEELHEGMEDDIFEFDKRIKARCNKLRESLHEVGSGNMSTETQSGNAAKVLIHG